MEKPAPTVSVAGLKARGRTRLPTLWTNSYFVATTGGAPLAIIKRYIERQKEV